MVAAAVPETFTTAGVQRSIRNVMTTYDFDKSSLVCDYDDGMRGIMPKAELGAPTPVSFEGETVWGVQDYDAYLTRNMETTWLYRNKAGRDSIISTIWIWISPILHKKVPILFYNFALLGKC